MLPQEENIREGSAPAEGQEQQSQTVNDDRVLCRLNKNFRLSKAQQILRLLRDQDDLNQRFRDCALLEDEDKDGDGDNDSWSVQEEQQSEPGESDSEDSEHEAERRAARLVALRKHRNSIDPGRCKTSMGFYNQAEVTEVPYDTDSDNVAGLDSACSTPRGGAAAPSGAVLGALPPPVHHRYEQQQSGMARGASNPSNPSNLQHNSRVRVYHFKMADSDVKVRQLAIPEDRTVQSARSSRPKTSLTSSSSTRSRYYRQGPHPECHGKVSRQGSQHHGPAQPQPQPQQQQQPQPQPLSLRGVGETRQAIISRLDPHHPMAVRPFCETRAAQEEAARKGVPPSPQLPSSQPSTPRGGARSQGNGVSHFNTAGVTLYDMTFPGDPPSRSSSRRAGGQGGTVARAASFADHQRVVPAGRPLLSVDSSPIQLGEVSPRGRILAGDCSVSRRPRSTRVKKRVGEMPRGAAPPASMHVLSERAHPSMAVMKLPPLETAVSKAGSGRDFVCVGKD